MADISKHIEEFKRASTGFFARKPIVGALTEINEIGGNAEDFSGHSSDELLKKSDGYFTVYLDEYPIRNSNRPVKSGGLYNSIGSFLKIDGFDPIQTR